LGRKLHLQICCFHCQNCDGWSPKSLTSQRPAEPSLDVREVHIYGMGNKRFLLGDCLWPLWRISEILWLDTLFTEKQASADKDQRWTPCNYAKLHKLDSLQLSYQIYTGSTIPPFFFMCQLLHGWSHLPSL
jgi:hypothetical protein